MPITEPLYATSDAASEDLAAFDRQVALAKDTCRVALVILEEHTRVRDADGRCFTAILEAIDDLVGDKRNAIRARVEEADISIEDAERVA